MKYNEKDEINFEKNKIVSTKISLLMETVCQIICLSRPAEKDV